MTSPVAREVYEDYRQTQVVVKCNVGKGNYFVIRINSEKKASFISRAILLQSKIFPHAQISYNVKKVVGSQLISNS